jgi:hypothetical protein
VTVRLPPPLETLLRVVRNGDDGSLLASARAARLLVGDDTPDR